MRVAAGAIAKKFSMWNTFGLWGFIPAGADSHSAGGSRRSSRTFFCPDPKVPEMEEYMAALNKEGNSIGAKIIVVANHVPVGLGEPVFDRLDADIAKALMSINAVKGVEIGAGFNSVIQKGSSIGTRSPLTGSLVIMPVGCSVAFPLVKISSRLSLSSHISIRLSEGLDN